MLLLTERITATCFYLFLYLDKRACLDNPCKNAGTCTELGQGDFTCTCAVGSKGKTCECKCLAFGVISYHPCSFFCKM